MAKAQTKKAEEKAKAEVEKTPAELINLVAEPAKEEKKVEAPKAKLPISKPEVALLRKYLKFQ